MEEKIMNYIEKSLKKDKNIKIIISTISIFMCFLMGIGSKLMFHLMNDYTGIIKLLFILIGGTFAFSSLIFIMGVIDLYIKKKDEKLLNIMIVIIYFLFLIFWFGCLIYYVYTLINKWHSSNLKELFCTLFLYLPGLLMSYTTFRKIRNGHDL